MYSEYPHESSGNSDTPDPSLRYMVSTAVIELTGVAVGHLAERPLTGLGIMGLGALVVVGAVQQARRPDGTSLL